MLKMILFAMAILATFVLILWAGNMLSAEHEKKD